MYNYYCKKCNTVVHSQNSPDPNSCSGGGNHTWSQTGTVGSKRYQCAYCGTIVYSQNSPPPNSCYSGGKNHYWRSL